MFSFIQPDDLHISPFTPNRKGMLSLEALRKVDPDNTADLTDEELDEIRVNIYGVGQLIFEDWHDQKTGSKNPIGSFQDIEDESTI